MSGIHKFNSLSGGKYDLQVSNIHLTNKKYFRNKPEKDFAMANKEYFLNNSTYE